MATMKEFLSFKRFLMPQVVQVLFWAGIGATLFGAWWLFTHRHWAWWMALIFGVFLTRLFFELIMIRYRSYEYLKAISERLDSTAASGH